VTDPYGYPIQPGAGQGGYAYQAPDRRPNGASAIIAAILGLVLAGVLAAIPIKLMMDIPSGASLGDVRGEVITPTALYLGAAVLLLIGSLVTFFRGLAGAILLAIGAVLALVVFLVDAPIIGVDIDEYLSAVFGLDIADAWFRFGALVLSPVVMIFALLPPTFRYLRYKPVAEQQWNAQQYPPQHVWGAQQQPGTPPPGAPQPGTPQSGAPQPGGQQQGGYPPQSW